MGARERRDAEFSRYVDERSVHLVRTAYLLCGDRHRAEDLVQTALLKVYLAWERVERREAVDAYARRTLVRAFIDENRRHSRREVVTDALPDRVDVTADHDDDGLLEELELLAPRQRAAVVLRYWHDLSVEDTARAMGCSVSTVKTQCHRGLTRLRDSLTSTAAGGTHDD